MAFHRAAHSHRHRRYNRRHFLVVQCTHAKLTRALDAYDYSAAAQVLPTLSKDELASVSDQMQEYAQTVIDRYNKSEANYDSSYELLDRLQKLFPNIGLDDQINGIQSLKDSKEAYKTAKACRHRAKTAAPLRNIRRSFTPM